MAQTNCELAHFASDVYRRKYSDYEILIDRIKCEHNESSYYIGKSNKQISIRDLNDLSNIMQYFGNHIQKMKVYYPRIILNGQINDWAMVNRLVNAYGSKSLTQLKWSYISKEIWHQFTVPFKNVETLELQILVDTDGMKLSQLFTNLKKLRIRLMNKANYDIIDCALPHLEHLDIFFRSSFYTSTNVLNCKEQIIGLIKKNSQIRSINVANTTQEFNKVIEEHLPGVERLTFTYGPNDEPLHFENVMDLVLYKRYQSSLRNLSFPHLKSLETSFFTEELEIFIEFFQRHGNLRRLLFQRIWCRTHHLKISAFFNSICQC